MLLSLFLTCFVALVLGTTLLLAVGSRVRISSAFLGIALTSALKWVERRIARWSRADT